MSGMGYIIAADSWLASQIRISGSPLESGEVYATFDGKEQLIGSYAPYVIDECSPECYIRVCIDNHQEWWDMLVELSVPY